MLQVLLYPGAVTRSGALWSRVQAEVAVTGVGFPAGSRACGFHSNQGAMFFEFGVILNKA